MNMPKVNPVILKDGMWIAAIGGAAFFLTRLRPASSAVDTSGAGNMPGGVNSGVYDAGFGGGGGSGSSTGGSYNYYPGQTPTPGTSGGAVPPNPALPSPRPTGPPASGTPGVLPGVRPGGPIVPGTPVWLPTWVPTNHDPGAGCPIPGEALYGTVPGCPGYRPPAAPCVRLPNGQCAPANPLPGVR